MIINDFIKLACMNNSKRRVHLSHIISITAYSESSLEILQYVTVSKVLHVVAKFAAALNVQFNSVVNFEGDKYIIS